MGGNGKLEGDHLQDIGYTDPSPLDQIDAGPARTKVVLISADRRDRSRFAVRGGFRVWEWTLRLRVCTLICGRLDLQELRAIAWTLRRSLLDRAW
jgi:hypothetical protein